MRLSDSTVRELLNASKKVPADKLKELEAIATKKGEPLQDLLFQHKLLGEKDLTKLYADSIKAKFIELSTQKIDPKILSRIPERIARQYQAVIFGADKNGTHVAMGDPGDLPAVDFLHKLLGKNSEIYIATSTDILHALDQYKGELDTEMAKVIPEDQKKTMWYHGLEHVIKQWQKFTSQHGIQRIDSLGREFNPQIHEAIQT